jgi:hypothetical protein
MYNVIRIGLIFLVSGCSEEADTTAQSFSSTLRYSSELSR